MTDMRKVSSHDENVAVIERTITEVLIENPTLFTDDLMDGIDLDDMSVPEIMQKLCEENMPNVYKQILHSHGEQGHITYAELMDEDEEEVLRAHHLAESVLCFVHHWADMIEQKMYAALLAQLGDHPAAEPVKRMIEEETGHTAPSREQSIGPDRVKKLMESLGLVQPGDDSVEIVEINPRTGKPFGNPSPKADTTPEGSLEDELEALLELENPKDTPDDKDV